MNFDCLGMLTRRIEKRRPWLVFSNVYSKIKQTVRFLVDVKPQTLGNIMTYVAHHRFQGNYSTVQQTPRTAGVTTIEDGKKIGQLAFPRLRLVLITCFCFNRDYIRGMLRMDQRDKELKNGWMIYFLTNKWFTEVSVCATGIVENRWMFYFWSNKWLTKVSVYAKSIVQACLNVFEKELKTDGWFIFEVGGNCGQTICDARGSVRLQKLFSRRAFNVN